MRTARNPAPVVILTGAYDDQYLALRDDDPCVCTSVGKRLFLYRAIAEAAGAAPLLLSPQPHGRIGSKPQPERQATLGSAHQLFAKASGLRKARVLLDMFHYAKHVVRHTPHRATLILDNYELSYVLATYGCLLAGIHPTVILEYEDGKHLIDRGIYRLMGAIAEWIAKPLVRGAILATPGLAGRLPDRVPTAVVPGILRDDIRPNPLPEPGQPVKFLYSGSLDTERGIPLLLDYLENTQLTPGLRFEITGQGHFTDRIRQLEASKPGNVRFHGCVSQKQLATIRSECHFGLNLQSSSDPISTVTYPSKTFDYLNAGLRVISTRAANVPDILKGGAIYLESETVEGLASAISISIHQARNLVNTDSIGEETSKFTYQGTVRRLHGLLARIRA